MATYSFNSSSNVASKTNEKSLLSKTFAYMFLLLFITVGVSVGLSCILQYSSIDPDTLINTYFIMMITASITQLVLTFVIVFSSLRQGKAHPVPLILYSVCMGVLLSSFTLYLSWWTLASAFMISALAFGGMALIGLFSKNASKLGLIGMGLLISILLASLFNVLLFVFVPGLYAPINIAISFIIIIAVMLITAYDVYNIRKISEAGQNSNNLALYLAFNLYVDFILILVRILQIIVLMGGGRR